MTPATPPSTKPSSSANRSSRSDSTRRHPSRREILAVAGTALTGTLAGCGILNGGTDVGPLHDGDWRSYGNGVRNTNRVAGGAPAPGDHTPLATGDWPYTPPVVQDGVAYFATGREVAAVGPDGGARWSRRLDTEVTGVPALDPNSDRIYVPTRAVTTRSGPDPAPASVTVLSLPDGAVVDRYHVGDGRTYGVSVAEGDVFARSATACVRLAPDGTERWRRSLDPLVYDEYNLGDETATQTAPALTEDGVYVPDRDALVKLDPETGDERWRVPIDTPYAAAVVDGGGVVQTGWQETVAVDRSGEVRWRRDLHSRAAAAADGGDLYVVAGDLHELDADTGETNWQVHVPAEGTAAPLVTDESVLVVSGDVRAFRRETGGVLGPDRERWRYNATHAAEYASPVVAAGRVLVAGPRGLVALRPADDG